MGNRIDLVCAPLSTRRSGDRKHFTAILDLAQLGDGGPRTNEVDMQEECDTELLSRWAHELPQRSPHDHLMRGPRCAVLTADLTHALGGQLEQIPESEHQENSARAWR